MDSIHENLIIVAIMIGVTQLFGFLIDFIAWAVRKRHPARIEKSEDVKYPQYLTVSVWSDSHRFHGYKKRTYIRTENNKYKKDIDLSVRGWITRIVIMIFYLLIIFSFPIAGFFYAPDFPHPELLIGFSFMIFLVFLHIHLTGPDTIARLAVNRYLKEQE